ncbi:MAG: hypothetical protein TR69_WS6001000387 [candidate division WS6 bacterium OLB20]|uniref:Uncharacterized protein n=1 Tax=candidate division WS6 bacterium OLB20 TaxID=1617426 RepID=A0A136LXJ4_9BACT|nr:MAG: hypothetical protein TR69_WS6001000387 [candidate division WS6 bacterium OLB20]
MRNLIHAAMALLLLAFAVAMFMRVPEACMQQLQQFRLEGCTFEDAGIPVIAAAIDLVLWLVLIASLVNRRARA